MQFEKPTDIELRIRAIEAAARVARSHEDIGNLLIHADWITSYVFTGRLPEVDTEQSAIAGSDVSAT